MSNAFMGQVVLFAGNYAPKNWAFCNGQLMSISQYSALFALLGVSYGGNGTSTFALPDLRGRVAVGTGQGPGTSNYALGETTGSENVTIQSSQMPQHTHTLMGTVSGANAASPASAFLSEGIVVSGKSPNVYSSTLTTPTAMGSGSVGMAGGSAPLSILQPLLAMNYIICIYGIFPSHN